MKTHEAPSNKKGEFEKGGAKRGVMVPRKRSAVNGMIRKYLYDDDRKGLWQYLVSMAWDIVAKKCEGRHWHEAIHRLGVCLFSEGVVLLCSVEECKSIVDVFDNLIFHGVPDADNVKFIEATLASLLGKSYKRGRVLDDLFNWVRRSDRTMVEPSIGGDLYAACLPERLEKIKKCSTQLIQGQIDDCYKLRSFVQSLLPAQRSVLPTCYRHMLQCARLAKFCHSDSKIVTQIHLAFKFLTLHYTNPALVHSWCKSIDVQNEGEDLCTWIFEEVPVGCRPTTPEKTIHDNTDQSLRKRQRVV